MHNLCSENEPVFKIMKGRIGTLVGSHLWLVAGTLVGSHLWSVVGTLVGSHLWLVVGTIVGSHLWSIAGTQTLCQRT